MSNSQPLKTIRPRFWDVWVKAVMSNQIKQPDDLKAMDPSLPRSSGQFVAELFVVVGWDEFTTIESIQESAEGENIRTEQKDPQASSRSIFSINIEASILDRYPAKDVAISTPDGISYFCFPLGLSIQDVPLPPQSHSFIHTSEDGTRLIGCVLAFSEELTETQRQCVTNMGFDISQLGRLYVRKGISVISRYPFISSFKKFLSKLYQQSLRASYVPIERYICNFIDDIPAPTSGKIDINFYFADISIPFQCPPLNEPNAWSGFPLFPLFECLSAVNIIAVFGLLLVDRQVLFISSQFSLLTLCCEAITSLLYPLRWAHAYIPILPARLVGALGAPFPYLFGVYTDLYHQNTSQISADVVLVFLDDNRVEFGALGPPPKFPERRYRKLLDALVQNVSWLSKQGQIAYDPRLWRAERLMLFDDALIDATDRPMETFSPLSSSSIGGGMYKDGNSTASSSSHGSHSKVIRESRVDDQAIRSAFLKFFVTMLKDYKRFLLYPSDPGHIHDSLVGAMGARKRFRFEEFVREQAAEWQPLLSEIVTTQAFSDFLDDRIALNKLDRDVIFFDESIEAKLNRYTFRMKSIDTPFLTYEEDKHTKTYVPPPPLTTDLMSSNSKKKSSTILEEGETKAAVAQEVEGEVGIVFQYPTFPRLQERWLVPQRNLAAKFSNSRDQILAMLCRVRLKRKVLGSHTTPDRLSGAASIFSSYMIMTALLLSHAIESLRCSNKPGAISTQQVISEFVDSSVANGSNSGSHSNRNSTCNNKILQRRYSDAVMMYGNNNPEEVSRKAASHHQAAENGLKVIFEALSSLTKMNYAPDEIVYRILAECCADVGQPWMLLDLLVFMDEQGFVPDHQILTAMVRAMTTCNPQQLCVTVTTSSTTPAQPTKAPQTLSSSSTHSQSSNGSGNHGSNTATKSASTGLSTAVKTTTKTLVSFPLTPVQVWSHMDWSTFARADTTVILRASLDLPAPISGNTTEDRGLTKILFGPNNGNRSSSSSGSKGMQSPTKPIISRSSHGPPSSSSLSGLPAPIPERDRWSNSNPLEGSVPHQLPWSSLDPESLSKIGVYAASSRLLRQVRLGELMLCSARYGGKDLAVNFTDPLGMQCPHPTCTARRPLTLGEVHRGWAGDAHRYTTKCPFCGHEFIPRFSVRANSVLEWCEYLSPWSLHKEVLNIVFEHGIAELLSSQFRLGSHQRTVVFWNLVVALRLRGLPLGVLLSGGSLLEAFPAKK